jgi:hypothetical protein
MIVAAAIVHAGTVSFETSNTLAMIGYHQGKAGHEFNIIGSESCLVDQNANNIIEVAQEMKCDYLFWLDTDVEFVGAGDVVGRMIEHDKDVTVGVYYQGGFPYRPVLYEFTDTTQIKNYVTIPEGLIRVDAAGGGFMLIKKKVLDLFTPDCYERLGKPFDPLMKGNIAWLRADAAFFWRLRELGVEVWADTTINLEHIKRNKVNRNFFLASKQMVSSEDAQSA